MNNIEYVKRRHHYQVHAYLDGRKQAVSLNGIADAWFFEPMADLSNVVVVANTEGDGASVVIEAVCRECVCRAHYRYSNKRVGWAVQEAMIQFNNDFGREIGGMMPLEAEAPIRCIQ